LSGGHAIGWQGRGTIRPWPNAAEGRSMIDRTAIAERIGSLGLDYP